MKRKYNWDFWITILFAAILIMLLFSQCSTSFVIVKKSENVHINESANAKAADSIGGSNIDILGSEKVAKPIKKVIN